jgi:hypothetical protein
MRDDPGAAEKNDELASADDMAAGEYSIDKCRAAAARAAEIKKTVDVLLQHQTALYAVFRALHAIVGTACITKTYVATPELAPAVDDLVLVRGISSYGKALRRDLVAAGLLVPPPPDSP